MKNNRTEVMIPVMNIMKATKKALPSGLDQIKLYMHDMRAIKLTFDKVSTITATYAQPEKKRRQTKRGSLTLNQEGSVLWRRENVPFESEDASNIKLVNRQMKKGDLFYDFICTYRTIISADQLFAFTYRLTSPKQLADAAGINGWGIYCAKEEYNRMWLPNDQWVISYINKDYKMCPTYPGVLCTVKDMAYGELLTVSKYRSKGRIPVLSWIHPTTGAVLTRSSQPLVGMGKRQAEDEKLLHVIRKSNGKSRHLHIIDARPKANAAANKTMGGGYEMTQSYDSCHIYFMGIENIHKMRESRNALFNMLKDSRSFADNGGWFSSLEDTQWLRHIYLVIIAAHKCVRLLERGESVLTHCSDGWDRTPQITALTQIMLDPYYRTLKGFIVLIEKEWLSFGHKFGERCGHGIGKTGAGEVSPIFLQFLDACWQLISIYPCSFEFSDALLVLLADEVYNCRFGTFLFNNEQERLKEHQVHKRTVSIWTYVYVHKNQYMNPFYRENPSVLNPKVGVKKMKLWESFFLRWEDQALSREKKEDVIDALQRELQQAKELIQQLSNQKASASASAVATSDRRTDSSPTPTTSSTSTSTTTKSSSSFIHTVASPPTSRPQLPPVVSSASSTLRAKYLKGSAPAIESSALDLALSPIAARKLSLQPEQQKQRTTTDGGGEQEEQAEPTRRSGTFVPDMEKRQRRVQRESLQIGRRPSSGHLVSSAPPQSTAAVVRPTDANHYLDTADEEILASADFKDSDKGKERLVVSEDDEWDQLQSLEQKRQNKIKRQNFDNNNSSSEPLSDFMPTGDRRERKKEQLSVYLFVSELVEEIIDDAVRVGADHAHAQQYMVKRNTAGTDPESRSQASPGEKSDSGSPSSPSSPEISTTAGTGSPKAPRALVRRLRRVARIRDPKPGNQPATPNTQQPTPTSHLAKSTKQQQRPRRKQTLPTDIRPAVHAASVARSGSDVHQHHQHQLHNSRTWNTWRRAGRERRSLSDLSDKKTTPERLADIGVDIAIEPVETTPTNDLNQRSSSDPPFPSAPLSPARAAPINIPRPKSPLGSPSGSPSGSLPSGSLPSGSLSSGSPRLHDASCAGGGSSAPSTPSLSAFRSTNSRLSRSFSNLESLRAESRNLSDVRLSMHWEDEPLDGAATPGGTAGAHSVLPPTWIPDSWARSCFRCKRNFNPLHRKHHCRHCGNIFCNKCTSKRLVLPYANSGDNKKTAPVRVCDPCYVRVSRPTSRNNNTNNTNNNTNNNNYYHTHHHNGAMRRAGSAAKGIVPLGLSDPLQRSSHDSFHQLTSSTLSLTTTPFESYAPTPASLSPVLTRRPLSATINNNHNNNNSNNNSNNNNNNRTQW
eukprot:TRINITY_DN4373_c0_g2_i5.p1 TRINITY_DN4373_c0_g2~~TRINITY_DN4373_c0_g2_i5.p1  ORF type:complete len:1345 (+),score=248.25 TRINITY_DN4373_c0_g2_i5:1355-5389(+)